MTDYEPFVSLGAALGAGLLIGIEREQSQDPARSSETFLGGARTFPLFALLGALSALLAPALTIGFPIAVLLGVVVMVAISYADELRHARGRGMTTEVAVLVTFVIGVLAASPTILEPLGHRVLVVAALAVVVTFVLSSKPRLRSLIDRVSRDDLYSTVKFLILAVLVLPLLPDEPLGPLGALRPFQVGSMVVLIAGIGFVGYLASRLLGPGRGLVVTALVGGLVSSTAVTLSFAGRAKKDPAQVSGAAIAIVLASTIMFGRVLVEVAVVHSPLLATLALPLAAMTVASLATALWLRRGLTAAGAGSAVPLTNPFELTTAVRFGLLFAVIVVVSKAAQTYGGSAGMYAAAALAGTTDVDAITLSTASMAREGLDPAVASTTILVATATNTVVKAAIAAVLGGWALGKRTLVMALAVLAAAVAGILLVWGVG